MRRVISLSKFYLRVMLSLFVWLIWVPYLTVWIWRMWFNPMLLLSQTSLGQVLLATGEDGKVWEFTFSTFLEICQGVLNGSFFNNSAINGTLLENDDGTLIDADWNGMLHTFFADVFEGQIITSIAVIIGLGLLCLKEYVVMNTPLDANGNPVNPDDPNGALAGENRPDRAVAVPRRRNRRNLRPRPLWGDPPNEQIVPRQPLPGAAGALPRDPRLRQVAELREFRDAIRNRDYERALRMAAAREERERERERALGIGNPENPEEAVEEFRPLLGRPERAADDFGPRLRAARARNVDLFAEGGLRGSPFGGPGEVPSGFLANLRGESGSEQRELGGDAQGADVPRDLFSRLSIVRGANAAAEANVSAPGSSSSSGEPIFKFEDPVIGSLDEEKALESRGLFGASRKGKERANDVATESKGTSTSFDEAIGSKGNSLEATSGDSLFSDDNLSQFDAAYQSPPRTQIVARPVEPDETSLPEQIRRDVEKDSNLRRADIDSMYKDILSRGPSRTSVDSSQGPATDLDAPASVASRLGFAGSSRGSSSRLHSEGSPFDFKPTSSRAFGTGSKGKERRDEKAIWNEEDGFASESEKEVLNLIKDMRERARREQTDTNMAQDVLPPVHIPVPPPPPLPVAPVQELALDNNNAAAAPVANANNNRPVALNVNVAVEVGPNGIAAEVQAQGDINAFLELVGMQGPLENLGQNMITVVLVIVAAIGAGVWLPFITGKVIVWLLADVYAPLMDTAISVGSQWLQVFTDPFLDPIADGVLILLTWAGLASHFDTSMKNSTTNGIVLDNIPSAEASVNDTVLPEVLETVLANASEVADVLNFTRIDESIPETVSVDGVSFNETAQNETSAQAAIMALREAQRNRLREAAKRLREPDTARLWGMPEQLAHTLVGYATHITLLYYHARRSGRLDHPYAQTIKRIFLKCLVYLVTAMKFTFFITIELGAFPTFCGILIDLCTLPIFGPTATIASRWAFYNAFPWSCWFLHWLTGTTFMFQFAVYVSTVRKVVRPGVVWFIRDPDDPAFHPMQDIIEKPILLQLRKLAVGTTTYSLVVISSVGGFVALVKLIELATGATTGPAKIWPIKWEFSEPLSEFPIDLLIFHFLLPWAIAWLRPRHLFRTVLNSWFRITARMLRLSHFLLGDRNRDEESDTEEDEDDIPVRLIQANENPSAQRAPFLNANADEEEDGWVDIDGDDPPQGEEPANAPADPPIAAEPAPAVNAGEPARLNRRGRKPRPFPYLRVPNHDHIEIMPGKMMVPMARGDALFGRANETEEEVRANWRRVYIPDRFRFRIFGLLFFQWICGLLLAAAIIVGPLYIGRVAFGQVHDYIAILEPGLVDLNITVLSNVESTPTPLLNASDLQDTSNRTSAYTPLSNAGANFIRKLGMLGAPVRPELPIRPDLPVHDLFAFSLGLFIIIASCAIGIWLERTAIWAAAIYTKMTERMKDAFENPTTAFQHGINAIASIAGRRRARSRQSSRRRRRSRPPAEAAPEGPEGADEDGDYVDIPAAEKESLWVRLHAVFIVLSQHAVRAMGFIQIYFDAAVKLGFLVFWVGLVIPLLFGMIFQLYIVLPALSSREQTRIFFVLQDWALGAMYTKIMYTLILAGPDTDIRRALAAAREQIREGGLNRFALHPFAMKAILPIVGICLVAIIPPIGLGGTFETIVGKGDDNAGNSYKVLFVKYSLLVLLGGAAAYEISQALFRLVKRWMEQVRDDQYLVGRRLHNLAEENNSPLLATPAQGEVPVDDDRGDVLGGQVLGEPPNMGLGNIEEDGAIAAA
ncbi:hypothetical protein HDU97_003545 [Phlyctochytrium planicorne]|nr:hypothetical protein HDU97_003545 [Phlyctochytrium planicorne]